MLFIFFYFFFYFFFYLWLCTSMSIIMKREQQYTTSEDDHIEETNLSEEAKDKKRLRITRACDFCRKKKVKCYFTPGKACTNCVSYGITCEFNDGAKKRGPPKGYIEALEKRIRQIESALTSMPNNKSTPSISNQTTVNEFQQDASIPVHKKTAAGGQSDSVQYLGDLSSFQFFSNKIKLDGSEKIWKGQRIRKFGKQVVLVGDMETSQLNANEVGQYMVPVPKIKTLFPGKDINNWIYSVSGVDNHTSDRLLKIYFANVHPVLPVVNKTNFLKQYRDQCDSYPAPDLLNAMFGAAARFVECESQYRDHNQFQPPDMVWDVPLGWSDHFFEQSQAFITQTSTLATLSKVQSIILIHNHSGNLDSKSSACWLLGGLAVRLAQGLGLYRDCEEWDIPDSEKETRKRVWWALYVTDRFHSASLGRPISIRDEDTDAGYPDASTTWKEVMDEPDDDEDCDGPRFPSATHKPENATEKVEIYQLFIQLVKLSEILGRILQGLYTPKAQRLSHEQGSDAIVTRLDHELTEWRFGFPKALQRTNFGDFDENTGYLSPVIATILICYYGLLVLLHRPFIERAGTGKSKATPSYSSFRIGSSAATRGIRIASQMEPRDFLMFPYAFSLYPVLQCCLIHMYNTKNPDTRIAGPAKVDLATGLNLINRLKKMSHNANKLHSLLETIMENNSIILNQNHDMDSSQRTSPKTTTATNTHNKNIVPSRISDVGRGMMPLGSSPKGSPTLQDQQRFSRTSQTTGSSPPVMQNFTTPLLFQQSLEMGSLADIPSMSTSPSPTSLTEAFSLKQFGFDTPGDPNQLDFTMQDVSAFSRMNYLPPMPGYQSDQQPQPNKNIYINHPPMENNNQDGNTAFRYNPNNPFFGIPSSMDWSDIAWNQTNIFK
ncbi:fungal-specific transcription factor domain-containing protein [Halteromyces radiatus]|uniref:fungal-specific transcription factor domain-containing protein n=1 Tax=Halteromyces radiatus TaxID=101107 RepID=UPI00221EC684|nr:fungal-specific transcription factor domain-containing protein [Halteromyces radiatus]KAI8076755.1 fungal-specific transcription factor domain-containing protein [Halteromyces radiatus]